MLVDLLVIALAAAFIVSLLERWVEHPLIRGGVSLFVSITGVGAFGYSDWRAVYLSLASAFAALLLLLVGERLATAPPLVIDSRPR